MGRCAHSRILVPEHLFLFFGCVKIRVRKGDVVVSVHVDVGKHQPVRVDVIVQSHGKQMIGWEEIAEADVSSLSTVQYWFNAAHAQTAARKGLKILMSPATQAYLDMIQNHRI